VSAKDKGTGKEQQIRIQASGGLSDAEIEQMVKDAESHAEDDKKRRELVEARNQAEALIHSTEKAVAEHGDKVGAEEKSAIETAIAELKSVREGEDVSDIQAKSQTLAQASMKLGEAMYKASQEEAASGASGGDTGDDSGSRESGATGSNEDVVDADFEEIPEDERKRSAS
jgi:molecular chaperone DnaK